MKVFILSAEHFSVPGLVLQAHATKASAVAEAVELVKTMLKDCEYPHRFKAGITASNWQDAIEWLQDVHGAAHCYVEIAETELHGAPADDGWTAAELQRVRDRANNMECLIAQAVEAWPQFDRDGDGELNVSGADLVDWFGEWRERAKATLDA